LPYQPDYVPVGLDSAFSTPTPDTLPAEDYTSGSIPDSPDAPTWPASFKQITIHSPDGAPLTAELAMLPGRRPGVVVVHGFNTHGIQSVIRWAAMLAARGYDVIAADQRDYSYEYSADSTYPSKWPQTFGQPAAHRRAGARERDGQPDAGGTALSGQTVAIPQVSRAQADSLLGTYICDTSQGPPAQ
jgi:hypothetical protein